MKKTFLALALTAGLTSFAVNSNAAIISDGTVIMSNMNSYGVTVSKADANIWFKLSQPENGLFNTLVLYGASSQSVGLKLNVYQWLAGGDLLTQSAPVTGIESNLGNGTSAYNFAIPLSLQNLVANNNGTALELQNINSSGNGFYQGNDNSIAYTIVNPTYASIITPGGQKDWVSQQYQGANYQFALKNTTAVPEPSTYALFGIGAIGMLMVMRRKKTA